VSIERVVPFLLVRDMQRSIAFYVGGLGFEIAQAWRPAGELRWSHPNQDGAGLMLQRHRPGQFDDGKGAGVTLCFFCDDAVALYHRFRAAGIDAAEPFVGNAMWVTGVTDPDGYRLDFESPADAPEEARLSEIDA